MEIEKSRTGLEQKLYEIACEVVNETGYGLYDLEYINGSKTLKVFIEDKSTGTAVIEDCIKVDHAFSPHFESNDWIPDEIVLEVSSPGMFRSLKTLDHFKKVKDQRIAIHLTREFSKVIGENECQDLDKKIKKARSFVCVLSDVQDDGVTLDLDDDFSVMINFNDIKKANLEPEI